MKIDNLIRELKREFTDFAHCSVADPRRAEPMMSQTDFERIVAKYASKPTKAIPPVRKKPRKGKLSQKDTANVREAVYYRDHGRCQLRLHPDCLGVQLPLHGPVTVRFHAAHIKGEGAGGAFTLENLQGACYLCHIEREHLWGKSGIKPCPKKAQ